MKRREIHEKCAECNGDGWVFYDRPRREEECPECLGIGKVFVGYDDDKKQKPSKE